MHKLNASQIRSGLCMKVLDFVMLHIFISQFSTVGLWEQIAGILNIQYFFFIVNIMEPFKTSQIYIANNVI